MRYIWKRGFDDKAFAASLVGLAVKGRLKIIQDNKDFSIARKEDNTQPLTQAEAVTQAWAIFGLMPGRVIVGEADGTVTTLRSAPVFV